jgi:hypothetical protein
MLGSAFLFGMAHTPYRQWAVYREKHLLIGANKAEPATYALAREIAALLLAELPASEARVARAPHAWRLASLLTTDQLQLVLLSTEDASALRDGRDGFEAFGRTGLRALHRFGGYWLICRPDFPDDHAALVSAVLRDHGAMLAKQQAAADRTAPVPVHEALAALAGAGG